MAQNNSDGVTIQDIWPDRASYLPGQPIFLHLRLHSSGQQAAQITLELRVTWLDSLVLLIECALDMKPGETETVVPVHVPADSFCGYGVDAVLRNADGVRLAMAGTAFDVLDDWTQAPRYGFLSDFSPDDPDPAASVQAMARYHINVVQFYDWMWRHYVLMPREPVFSDALGRRLSMHTVRAKTAACAAHGMATMGYAAVYGAEPEYAFTHPDEMLYDESGKPHSLVNLFYIMNIHQGSPWRAQILKEMARSVAEAPFDGLHLDQYGFPKETAYGPGPNPVAYNLAEDFPTFIDDARAAIRNARPETRVIFNAVENWPIETIAPTTQDATYIEVWPPDDQYRDLQRLILEARRLAPAKQVILAAYLKPLLSAIGDDLPPAERATRLASAAIWANGGFHLLMGENQGALCDPYYPKYATMRPEFTHRMRRYYDFVVRYENVLCDRRLITTSGTDAEATAKIAGRVCSTDAQPGTIWTIMRSMSGVRTLSLINLTATDEAGWNVPKPPVSTQHRLSIDMYCGGRVTNVFVADPDGQDLSPQQLAFEPYGEGAATRIRIEAPRLEYWTLVVARLEEAGSW